MKIHFRKYYKQLLTNNSSSNEITSNKDNLSQYITSPIRFSIIIIAIAISFFVLWGSLAPLDSASIAPGCIVLSGNHKTIQHLEGGVIDKILVKEGDSVEENQPLLLLNEIPARARLHMILSQLRTSKAIENRLLAEQSDKNDININPHDPLLNNTLPEVQKILETQYNLFQTRIQSIQGKLNILSQKKLQYQEHIKGLQSLSNSLTSQQLILSDQTTSMRNLIAQGGAPKNDLLELQKRHLEIEGKLGEIKSNIAAIQESISETELQMFDLKNDSKNEINDQLQKIRSQIVDLQEQYQAAEDILTRSIIRAPKAGTITNLQYHTIGGVITPSAKIMDIVPQNDELIVEIHIMPKDIERIQVGLKVKVQLSAYKSRLVPRLDGELIYLSADKLTNERNGYPYYIGRVRIPKESLEKINYNVKLYPGMPADAFIVKGESTFLKYLLNPILDSCHRSFKEN